MFRRFKVEDKDKIYFVLSNFIYVILLSKNCNIVLEFVIYDIKLYRINVLLLGI